MTGTKRERSMGGRRAETKYNFVAMKTQLITCIG